MDLDDFGCGGVILVVLLAVIAIAYIIIDFLITWGWLIFLALIGIAILCLWLSDGEFGKALLIIGLVLLVIWIILKNIIKP